MVFFFNGVSQKDEFIFLLSKDRHIYQEDIKPKMSTPKNYTSVKT